MNDRELLELAAKASGDETYDGQDGHLYLYVQENQWYGPSRVLKRWNPLTDDGDALRLAVTLRLDVFQDELSVSVKRWNKAVADSDYLSNVSVGESRLSTTRRAIVLAAAEIGKAVAGRKQ